MSSMEDIDERLKHVRDLSIPEKGWIHAIRQVLGMSVEHLGAKMGLSVQGVHALEKREQNGTVTLDELKRVADALKMDLSYIFIPKTSLEGFIDSANNTKKESSETFSSNLGEKIQQLKNFLKKG